MNRRLLAFGLLAFLLMTFWPAPPASSSGIPVIDAANLLQAVLDYIMRLFEIIQRATMIANQIQELDYWFEALLKLGQVPYRADVLQLLEIQRELLKEFDDLKGQYQAISHSLDDVAYEFDITFPGWRAVSDLASGDLLQIESEAGIYDFGSPLEYARYQSARALQAVRQTVLTMAQDQASLLASQAHLEELKGQVPLVEGHQQALEIQTSFAALSAEQLVALRQSQSNLALTVGALGAHRLSSDMQLHASQEGFSEDLRTALLLEFGAPVPEHTGQNGIDPFPSWVTPY